MKTAVLFAIGVLTAFDGRAQTLVHFKTEYVSAPDSPVHLYDLVAEDSKKDVEPLRGKLSAQIVTRVQKDGERVELSTASLTQHLKATLSDAEKDQYRFSLPRVLKIRVEAPQLTAEVVESLLRARWQAQCQDCQLQISQIQLPLGSFRNWELIVPPNLPKGSFNVPLRVKGADGKEAQYWIQGKIEILKQVPIAQRALYIGERIRAEDVKFEWRSVTFANDGAPAKNLILGLRLKSPVSANQIVWSRNLEREKALKRGDVVRAYSSGGSWELSMNVVAQKDADVGDVVELKSPKSAKLLSGVVTGQGEVEIK